MTCTEAENAYTLSVIECRQIHPAIVACEKAQTVKKSGLLEVVEVHETLQDTGGGTSDRVFGSFISWTQERTWPVFIIATANDVTRLPPELLRKGRWHECFWIDLPNRTERESIWKIKISQRGRDPKKYDVAALGGTSEGYTGAEIEGVVADSLFRAFAKEREPTTEDMEQALRDTVPLSTLSDQVDALRKWARGWARPASSGDDGGNRGSKICGVG